MKRLLLFSVLTVLFSVPFSPARAGVPCSVPFNLTNGTTADATQVMANYNAILTCLSTSAAANGSNNDITALNGLITPLTPTQAPGIALCGASGFNVVNDTGTPTTELDITFTEAIVTNSLGAIQRGVSGSLVLNAGTSGAANGIDTGSLAASTNYFIWLIGNGSTVASLLSLSSTAPTLPSGYTYQCRVGAWTTNTALHFVTGTIRGRNFVLQQKPGGTGSNLNAGAFQINNTTVVGTCGTSTDTTVLTAFTGLPTTAIKANGTTFTGTFLALSSEGPTTNNFNEVMNTGAFGNNLLFDLTLPASQSLYYCSVGAGSFNVNILGWTDNTNAN